MLTDRSQPSGPRFPCNVALLSVGLIAMVLAVLLPLGDDVSPWPCPTEVSPITPADSLPHAVGVPLVGPLQGQKVPPCKGPKEKGLREYELRGACWYRVDGEPPCGEGYELGAFCYAPVPSRFKVPSTVGREVLR